MDWKCPDCKRLEHLKEILIEQDTELYLCCSGCGALLFLTVKRSKDSKAAPAAWGIPRKDK